MARGGLVGEPARVQTRNFWQQASAEVDRGETIAAVARRRGVRPRTLSWWRWKLKSERGSAPAFLPVVVASRPESSAAVEIAVETMTVRAEVGADIDYVVKLAVALRRQC